MSVLTFKPWPKTPRLNRDMVITEKIDGTNAAVIIQKVPPVLGVEEYDPEIHGAILGAWEDFALTRLGDHWYMVGGQSRNRVLTLSMDNAGFAKWVFANAGALVKVLGEGYHYGEWWGSGIQRGYGLTKGEKRFSLFNVARYGHIEFAEFGLYDVATVPVLYRGPFSTEQVNNALIGLKNSGSYAAPGFMRPEGIIVFHEAANSVFKVLVEGDEISKTEAGVA